MTLFITTINQTIKLKKSTKHKILITLGMFFILFVAVFILLPYLLRDKIIERAKVELNSKLNAQVDFDDINISFIRSFPYASVRFEKFYITGVGDFKNDTLLYSESINLSINLKSLFSDTGYDIRQLEFISPKVVVRVLDGGRANWKILKTDSTAISDSTNMQFHWKLNSFSVKNADIYYHYDKSGMDFIFKNVNHSTTGDLTADSSLLVTKTTCDSLSFIWDGFAWVDKAHAVLNADINANLNDMIFTFSQNNSQLNEIPFSFSGWLQSIPEGWDMDFKLNTEKLDFKSILSVVPVIYANSFDKLQTGGKVDLGGFIRGKWIGDFYPAFDLKLTTQDAWFHYPALPEKLQKININLAITNPGKTLDETIFDFSEMSFLLGKNPFMASALVTHPMSDTEIKLNALGKIDLGMIKRVYPLDKNTNLNGLIDVNLKVEGKQSYFESNNYDRFQFNGLVKLLNMNLKVAYFEDEIAINKANLNFNNRYLNLSDLQLKIGRNDLSANAKVENYIGYLFYDKTLNANLKLNADYLNLNDFLSNTNVSAKSEETNTVQGAKTKLKTVLIPGNINFDAEAIFNELHYGSMSFTKATGKLAVTNHHLYFNNMRMNAFGGTMLLNGSYNSLDTLNPEAELKLDIQSVVFKDIFSQVESLQQFVPVFSKATGKFSTQLNFRSTFDAEMSPELTTTTGAGIFNTNSVSISETPVLNALLKAFKKEELFPANLNDLLVSFEIENGKIITKPFALKLWDMNFTLEGETGLNKTINYKAKVKLPDKYKLGRFSVYNVKIGGTFSKPKIEIDLKNTINEVITETKEKIETVITQQIDAAKEKALEEARIEKEKLVALARIQADKLINDADKAADKLINTAKIQGDKLISKATNPLTKLVAQSAANKLEDEAREQAEILKQKAKREAEKLIEDAERKTEF